MALLLIAGITYLFTNFSMRVEPESSFIVTAIFGLVIGILSQAGLFLSTTRFGVAYKLLTCGLMLPFTLLLLGTNYDLVSRLLEGNPLSLTPSIMYIFGITIYVYSYQQLIKTKPYAT